MFIAVMYAPTLPYSLEKVWSGNPVITHKMVHHCLQPLFNEMGIKSFKILVTLVQRRSDLDNPTASDIYSSYFKNDT